MLALPAAYGDISQRMTFDDAKLNFFRAARHGLDAQFNWLDGKAVSAQSLVLDQLLPLARQGLETAKVAAADIQKYLGVIEARVRSRQTGARWVLKSLAAMDQSGPKEIRLRQLTATMLATQKKGLPVHTWPEVKNSEPGNWEQAYRTVGQFMTTDLFTVQPDDLIDLAASVMDWRHIRHVPVENEAGDLVGLITHRNLLRLVSSGNHEKNTKAITVREVMVPNPVTVTASTPTLDAIKIMREQRIGCLLIVEDRQLLGIVTSYDFLDASAQLFQQHLTVDEQPLKTRAVGQSRFQESAQTRLG
jgi:CBS domain-containing protein